MKAVYPGSFDPTTYGHMDIIERAAAFTDELIVAVLNNSAKKAMFTIEERLEMIRQLTAHLPNVKAMSFSGLLVNFAEENDARLIIRGLRAVTDFENEFQMALTNRSLNNNIETLFISTSTQYLFLSSSIVKEVATLGGNVDEMVSPIIKEQLLKKIDAVKPNNKF